MPINISLVQDFKSLFTGSLHNYGEYIYEKNSDDSKDKKIEGSGRTIKDKLITLENYRNHLGGKKGLGIIPITENDQCHFSVIDLDVYDEDLNPYVRAIERGDLPLVPFRSKSGGLHIYLFYSEPIQARRAIEIMRVFANLLSLYILLRQKNKDHLEIFPKQTHINKGEYGNWINLPYYDHENTNSYCIVNGKKLSLVQAINHIQHKRVSRAGIEEVLSDLKFQEAPPCLQQLYLLNPFDENSNRNNYLFSMGVFLKKKDEEFFDQHLLELNNELLVPLEEKEVRKTIVSSIKRKDYSYKCKSSPCLEFCDKKECRKREYGIGKDKGYFSTIETGQLYQFKTFSPYYEWEVKNQEQENFVRLRFKSEDELLHQDAFLRLCMRDLHEIPTKLKQAEWHNRVNQALKEIKIISVEDEDDTSPLMILKGLIADFLFGRSLAETKNQILADRVYYDSSTGEYLFRVKDLIRFLYLQKQFKYYSPQDLHGILREMNCRSRKITTETRDQVRVSAFSKKSFEKYEEDLEKVFEPDFSEYTDGDF